jgi:tight adherence protein B
MTLQVITVSVLLLWAIECSRRGLARLGKERAVALAQIGLPLGKEGRAERNRSRSAMWSARAREHQSGLLGVGAGLLGGLLGLRLVGPLGLVAGMAIGAALPRLLKGRSVRTREQDLERQLAEVAESTAMAVRSGLSIGQALELAGEEADEPMSDVLARFANERRLGVPFEDALRRLGDHLRTADARLFALVVSIHARSGGNLSGALDEVAATIRHRIAVRRELRALSAQGRISGAILGALPIAFFLVLAATSHRELGPVYRSPAGIAMVSSGLFMECLAFVWIRRLLRVEA